MGMNIFFFTLLVTSLGICVILFFMNLANLASSYRFQIFTKKEKKAFKKFRSTLLKRIIYYSFVLICHLLLLWSIDNPIEPLQPEPQKQKVIKIEKLPLPENEKTRLYQCAVEAVQLYELGDGKEFAQGFVNGVEEILTADLLAYTSGPSIQFYLDRFLLDHFLLVSENAGKFSAYQLLYTVLKRKYGNPALTTHQIQETVQLLNQVKRRAFDTLNHSMGKSPLLPDIKERIHDDLNKEIFAMADPSVDYSIAPLSSAAAEKIATEFADIAQVISNDSVPKEIIIKRIPEMKLFLKNDIVTARKMSLPFCLHLIIKHHTAKQSSDPVSKEMQQFLSLDSLKEFLETFNRLQRMIQNEKIKQRIEAQLACTYYLNINDFHTILAEKRCQRIINGLINQSLPGGIESEKSSLPTLNTDFLIRWELRNKVLRLTHDKLMEKYKITVTAEEIRKYAPYLYKPSLLDISEEKFQEYKIKAEQYLAAAEAVVEKGMNPAEAIKSNIKVTKINEAFTIFLAKLDRNHLEEMRKMIPPVRDVLFERNYQYYQKSVEKFMILLTVQPQGITEDELPNWHDLYETALLEYAKENVIGKCAELKDVKTEDINFLQ